MVQGHARRKSSQDPILTNKKLGTVAYTCHPIYAEGVNRRMVVQAGLGIKAKPYLKSNQSKKG
jgi:hypothetical protein